VNLATTLAKTFSSVRLKFFYKNNRVLNDAFTKQPEHILTCLLSLFLVKDRH